MNKVSIKRDIYLYLFGIVFALTAIYGLMVSHSYHIGLNESAKYGFLYELKVAEHQYLSSGKLANSPGSTLQVYLDLAQVPDKFLNAFDWSRFSNDAIYEHYLAGQVTGEYLYAAKHAIANTDITLYVTSQYDEAIYLDLFELNPPESVNQFNSAFVLIGGLLLLVFIIIRWLIYRLTKPILILSDWSQKLDLDQVDTLQHFRYREIDQLAQQLVESVRNERDAIEREEFFLSAASHELRTPIATMSASSEMLTRLADSLPTSGQRAAARIQRSALAMQSLVTTLLWISRDLQQSQCSSIEAQPVVKNIIASHRYLLADSQTTIELDANATPIEISAPQPLFEVVLTNLVRNAFQHSSQGRIQIRLTSREIEVINPIDNQQHEGNEPSFGIGLVLVEKICHKQGWQFAHQVEQNCYLARIVFYDQ